ncbi:NPC intracellular cholesterol transporter 2 homolog a [Halyomorpha halys]|uniref:NPC intracellular cholesterol transporter 2 homolog a n=1 Tax=Halyomorpha halys TaxID=286706 RepID=UPI0006D4C75C|nr:NPC intracellular cholesterol transporter 2 homolog a-like [Halyomorpha halys]
MILLLFVSLITVFHSVITTTVDQCTDKTIPQPIAVRVSNCTTPPCDLVRTTTAVLEIDFEATKDLAELKAASKAFALGVETVYPLPNDDVCSALMNGECPLDAGEVVTYRLEMPILDSFPKVHALIQFSLVSGSDTIVCFKVAANVVDP